jgi:hypothetical protein
MRVPRRTGRVCGPSTSNLPAIVLHPGADVNLEAAKTLAEMGLSTPDGPEFCPFVGRLVTATRRSRDGRSSKTPGSDEYSGSVPLRQHFAMLKNGENHLLAIVVVGKATLRLGHFDKKRGCYARRFDTTCAVSSGGALRDSAETDPRRKPLPVLRVRSGLGDAENSRLR